MECYLRQMSDLGSIAQKFSRSLLDRLRRWRSKAESPPALEPAAIPLEEEPFPMPAHPYGPHLRVLIQGTDRPLGDRCAARMQAYKTPAIAGVAAGRAGARLAQLPTFDLVERARDTVGELDLSLIATEPFAVLDAGLEAIAAGIRQIFILTPGVPPLDMMQLLRKAETANAVVLGAGSRGIIAPGQALLGNYDAQFYRPGAVGLVSGVGCLTDEVAISLGKADLGQSLVVNLGTEEILASSYEPWLEILNEDPGTAAIALVARADRGDFEAVADYIATDIGKPVIAYLAGHASHDCQAREAVLREAGVILAERPGQIPIAIAPK